LKPIPAVDDDLIHSSFLKSNTGDSPNAGQIEPKFDNRIGMVLLEPSDQGHGLPIPDFKKEHALV
jgi:hypothetical protein